MVSDWGSSKVSAQDVQRCAQHFIPGLQNFEIGLVGALDNHQIGDLFRQVYVGSFFKDKIPSGMVMPLDGIGKT
jgi:hypothetical protein